MAAGTRALWSLDEYIVVADLYLRRARSSNARDPEVVELAGITGRSSASISRRLGNFHGTAKPGAGLKPVTGEALTVFTAMSEDLSTRRRLAKAATQRLRQGMPSAPIVLPRQAVAVINIERMHVAEADVSLPAITRKMVRAEAQLVDRYVKFAATRDRQLFGMLIPTEGGVIRPDLYDPDRNLLIEAKADSSRDFVRYAIGQLLDYQRHVPSRPGLSLLAPSAPAKDMLDLLAQLQIGVIYPLDEKFDEVGFG